MVTQNPSPSKPLTREEREVWLKAYLVALEIALDSGRVIHADGETVDRSLAALVRASVEAAWASLDAYRLAVKGERS